MEEDDAAKLPEPTALGSDKQGEQIMAVVGIDLGTQSTKVVILEGDAILGGASLRPGNRRRPRPGWRCRRLSVRRASSART